MVIKVGPDVQHIEKIKVEDKITVTYSEEVATSLQRLAGPPINKDSSITRAEESGMSMNAPTRAEQDWVEVTPSGQRERPQPSQVRLPAGGMTTCDGIPGSEPQ